MEPAVLVMAAGMGSRYGGLKQIDPVGPSGETLLDYSLFDAHRAGFGRVVFVIRRDIEAAFREAVGRRYEARTEVVYAFQSLEDLPAGFRVPAGRAKPWGTGQAVLAGESAIDGPFAVVNADDFYGRPSYEALHAFLAGRPPADLLALVAFRLDRTLSPHGPVARGLCEVGADGLLRSVREITGLERDAGGVIRSTDGAYRGDEPMSLNLWGFGPSIFDRLRERFRAFLAEHGGEEKSEFYLPDAVGQLIRAGTARVRVLETPSPWFGMTHRADAKAVSESLRALVAAGEYPEPLWGG
ncbi:MAG TPA: nucleotidyltransferase [Vicinamibacteria bacterium]